MVVRDASCPRTQNGNWLKSRSHLGDDEHFVKKYNMLDKISTSIQHIAFSRKIIKGFFGDFFPSYFSEPNFVQVSVLL